MTGFKQTWAAHELEKLEALFDKEYALAMQLLKPSLDAVATVVKEKGPSDIMAVVAAMASAAAAGLTGGASAAGQAALAAAGTTVLAEATDALHAIATATVTAAKTAAPVVDTTPVSAPAA
jgi:hypothetical protein